MRCPECKMMYTGHAARSFYERFEEHFNDYKYRNCKSKFALCLLDNKHSMGQIEDIMGVVYVTNKDSHMNTMQKFYIYQEKNLRTR